MVGQCDHDDTFWPLHFVDFDLFIFSLVIEFFYSTGYLLLHGRNKLMRYLRLRFKCSWFLCGREQKWRGTITKKKMKSQSSHRDLTPIDQDEKNVHRDHTDPPWSEEYSVDSCKIFDNENLQGEISRGSHVDNKNETTVCTPKKRAIGIISKKIDHRRPTNFFSFRFFCALVMWFSIRRHMPNFRKILSLVLAINTSIPSLAITCYANSPAPGFSETSSRETPMSFFCCTLYIWFGAEETLCISRYMNV